jgi:hypothetical protein
MFIARNTDPCPGQNINFAKVLLVR